MATTVKAHCPRCGEEVFALAVIKKAEKAVNNQLVIKFNNYVIHHVCTPKGS